MSDRSAEDLLAVLAAAAGISSQDLQTTISAAADARRQQEASKDRAKSVYQDRELVYDDESAFIFRRGNTKSRTYYLRIYDTQSRRPFVKSLRERLIAWPLSPKRE